MLFGAVSRILSLNALGILAIWILRELIRLVLEDSMVIFNSEGLTSEYSAGFSPSLLPWLTTSTAGASGWVLRATITLSRVRCLLLGPIDCRIEKRSTAELSTRGCSRHRGVIDCDKCFTIAIVDHVLESGLSRRGGVVACGATSGSRCSCHLTAGCARSTSGASQVGRWVHSLIHKLTTFLLEKELEGLRIVDLISPCVRHDSAHVGCCMGRLLKGKWIASDDKILQRCQLSDCIEQLFFVRHLVEGKVELFKAGEYLVIDVDRRVVVR